MRCRRVSQAELGRSMETRTTARHNIKRVSRFITNERVDVTKGCRGLVRLAAKPPEGASSWRSTGSTYASSRCSRPPCRSAAGPLVLTPAARGGMTDRRRPQPARPSGPRHPSRLARTRPIRHQGLAVRDYRSVQARVPSSRNDLSDGPHWAGAVREVIAGRRAFASGSTLKAQEPCRGRRRRGSCGERSAAASLEVRT